VYAKDASQKPCCDVQFCEVDFETSFETNFWPVRQASTEVLVEPERDFDEFVRVAEAVCKRLTAEQ
jgi:hypothetical protein